MPPIRIGVAGVGWIAQVVHLPILLGLPDCKVTAVCDKDRRKARLVGEKFKIPHVFTDLKSMLDEVELDAVIISTSTDMHAETAIQAIEAGKDVLVEKPIARTLREAMAIAESSRTHNRKVLVGMNQRFRPDSLLIKKSVEEKDLGKILYVRTGWLRRPSSNSAWFLRRERSGGGVFVDLGIAMLDMALWMCEYPAVRRVNATMFHHHTKGVEDTSVVTLVLGNGASIIIEVSWSLHIQEDVFYCHVFGTEGTGSLQPLRIVQDHGGTPVSVVAPKGGNPQSYFHRSYENELRHFLDVVRGKEPAGSTIEEAVECMRIVEAVYRSAARGKECLLS